MPRRGELSGQRAVTQPGSPREWQDDTHLPGPLSTEVTAAAAALSPKFTSFPALSPLLGEGEPQNLHVSNPLPLGCCIWPECTQVLQLPAFIYKLSPVRDEPQSVS